MTSTSTSNQGPPPMRCPRCNGDITHAYFHDPLISGWYCANCDLITAETTEETDDDDQQ